MSSKHVSKAHLQMAVFVNLEVSGGYRGGIGKWVVGEDSSFCFITFLVGYSDHRFCFHCKADDPNYDEKSDRLSQAPGSELVKQRPDRLDLSKYTDEAEKSHVSRHVGCAQNDSSHAAK